ncbi:MAG: hypothetical protein ACMXX9_01090 [Candidatus Woesearchaeota archaeon]
MVKIISNYSNVISKKRSEELKESIFDLRKMSKERYNRLQLLF